MELVGKVVSPNRSGLDLNGATELLVNTKSGRITLSKSAIKKLDTLDLCVGFGYDEQELQGARAFLYLTVDGCKVGKGGTVSSKWHASKLKEMFITSEGMVSETSRFKVSIDLETSVDFEGTSLFPISFSEALADLVRTQKVAVEVDETSAPIAPCSAHAFEEVEPEGQELAEEESIEESMNESVSEETTVESTDTLG